MPSTTSAQSKVKCPHCQQIISLADLLDQSAPEVEVLEIDELPAKDTPPVGKPERAIDQQASRVKDEHGKFVVPSQLSNGARRRRRRSSSRSSSRSKQRDRSRTDRDKPTNESHAATTTSQPQKFETATRDDSSLRQRSARHAADRDRQRRRSPSEKAIQGPPETNLAWELAKFVMGVCLAMPLAYLLVLWVLGMDPLGAGRSAGNLVPGLVPQTFRAVDENSDTASAEDDVDENAINDVPFDFNETLQQERRDFGTSIDINEEALRGFDR